MVKRAFSDILNDKDAGVTMIKINEQIKIRTMMNHKAFTLIELLVVIAIIGPIGFDPSSKPKQGQGTCQGLSLYVES